MLRRSLLIAVIFFAPLPLAAQSAPSDSQTLQALLLEVRQLRHDFQSTTIAMQRSQILLHRLDVQAQAVQRAQERRDETQSKLTEIQDNIKETELMIKQAADQSQNSGQDATSPANNEINGIAGSVVFQIAGSMKARLQSLQDDEQQAQVKLSEAEDQLRTEQSKLAELEEQLDRLDRSLSDLAHQQ